MGLSSLSPLLPPFPPLTSFSSSSTWYILKPNTQNLCGQANASGCWEQEWTVGELYCPRVGTDPNQAKPRGVRRLERPASAWRSENRVGVRQSKGRETSFSEHRLCRWTLPFPWSTHQGPNTSGSQQLLCPMAVQTHEECVCGNSQLGDLPTAKAVLFSFYLFLLLNCLQRHEQRKKIDNK